MIVGSHSVCWGSDPRWAALPIVNLPSDAIKIRRRLRNNDVAQCFVKTPSGISRHYLSPIGSISNCQAIELWQNIGGNYRENS